MNPLIFPNGADDSRMLGPYTISQDTNSRRVVNSISAVDQIRQFELGMNTSGDPALVGFSITGAPTPSNPFISTLVLWLTNLTASLPFTVTAPSLTINAPTSFIAVPSLPLMPQFLPCQLNLLIDFRNVCIANFFMIMTTDLEGVDFVNVEEGGIYSVVVRCDNNPHIIRKALGAGLRNNLNGDVSVAPLSAFSIDIRLGLGIYFLSFNFFT